MFDFLLKMFNYETTQGRGQLQQVAQDCNQLGFEYLEVWRLHNISGQPIFNDLHKQISILLCLRRISCMSVCACCLLFLSLASLRWMVHFLYSPHQRFIHIDEISLCLLFSRLYSPSSHRLFLYDRCSSPFIIVVAQCWTCYNKSVSLLYQRPHDCTQHSWSALPVLSKGNGSPHLTCWKCSA